MTIYIQIPVKWRFEGEKKFVRLLRKTNVYEGIQVEHRGFGRGGSRSRSNQGSDTNLMHAKGRLTADGSSPQQSKQKWVSLG